MSHVVTAKTDIVLPGNEADVPQFLDVLRKALNFIAGQHEGGGVYETYLDYANHPHKPGTGLAIRTQRIRRGIGLDINSQQELVFIGDPYGVSREFEQMKSDINQAIKTMVTLQELEAMGLVATIEVDEESGVFTVVGMGVINA